MMKTHLLRAAITLAIFASAAASAQTVTTLVNFGVSNDDGGPGFMSLVQGRDGHLYGTSGGGTNYQGAIFKVTLAGVLANLHNFSGQANDGRNPESGLVLGSDGNFYGATSNGGADDFGTVFRISSTGDLTTLYSFLCTTVCEQGSEPIGPLVQAADGTFYGTTSQAGANGDAGTIFRIGRDGTLTTLYNFCAKANCSDGNEPYAALIQALDGNFYGTTYAGGVKNNGTVFRVTPSGKLITLHRFVGSDGAEPTGALVQASDGNIYGTTTQGGAYGHGAVFSLNQSGIFTLLHSFCALSGCSDGDRPQSGLIQATDGNLYGTTFQGGVNGFGTVFSLNPSGSITIIHSFDLHTDGGQLDGGLLQDTNGIFYGTTSAGGAGNGGTIFSIDMGLGPFVGVLQASGRVGKTGDVLGQGFTGTTSVAINGSPASFHVVSDTLLTVTVPGGATTGYITVTTPGGTLTSNVPFHVLP